MNRSSNFSYRQITDKDSRCLPTVPRVVLQHFVKQSINRGCFLIANLQQTPAGTIDILRRQHSRLNQLLLDYFAARSASRQWDLIPLVLDAVKLHVALEADVLFPLLELASGDKTTTIAAKKEQEVMEGLVDELVYPDPGSADTTEKMYFLWEVIRTHIASAERPGGLFERWHLSTIDDDAATAQLRNRYHELWCKFEGRRSRCCQ